MNVKIAAVLVAAVLVGGGGIGAYLLLNDNDDGEEPVLQGHLQVYGNANEDWTVDEKDVEYIEAIIAGTEDITEYADANRDGKIDEGDVEQIRRLASNEAEYVWIVDGAGETMKVGCKPERIYTFQVQNAELCAIMNVGGNVVAGGPPIEQYAGFLFPNDEKYREYFAYDWERMAELDLDLYLVFSPAQKEEPRSKLPGVDVVYLGLYEPIVSDFESSWGQGILKAGYIFGCKERAEKYLDFLLEIKDKITEKVSNIAEEDRVNVLVSGYGNYTKEESNVITVYLRSDTISQAVELAGGRNVASSLANYKNTYGTTVDVEWLAGQDIDWMTMHYNYYGWTGISGTDPKGGYTFKNDESEMNDFLNRVALKPLLSGIPDGQIVFLPQDFRNGCNGGILCAAYLAEAFYPDAFEDGFADRFMEEYLTEWMGLKDYNFSEYRDSMVAYGNRAPA